MRELILPQSGPKRKLLESAEQLFAENGFEAVSVRDITQLSKANVAAVNYHFGSRDGLLNLVIARYSLPVNDERILRLETVERKWAGKAIPVEEIVDAFVRPILSQVRKTELLERSFYKLLGRIFALRGDGLSEVNEEGFRKVNERFMRAFGKAIPSVMPDELTARIHFMSGAVIHLLTHQGLLSGSSDSGPTMEANLSRLIRFAVAGLRDGVDMEEPAKKGPQATFDF